MDQFYVICVYVIAGILGLCVGSFLNVVIYRLPRELSLAFPGSHCTRCDYQLKWYDNIPVLSWIMLKGKCRKCGEPISVRYTVVELANMVMWLLSVLLFWATSPVYAVLSAIVCSTMICIFFIDLEHMLIYNRFVLIVAAAGIVAMFHDGYTKPADHVIGALVGGGLFALLYFGAIWVLKREAMGFGDVKFAAAIGLLLGWQKFLFAVLIASVVGSIVLVLLNRINNQERTTEYPFGPFLVGGALVSMFIGAPLITWYVALIIG
ncbi:MAG: prepilin peptidase [Clostridia bacterium]|nr:prepilin peptidase [Clostridia bacterium]